jgi:hypothetical protein
MGLHRIVGSALALAGFATLSLLAPALYGPTASGLRLVVRIGIPGVLLICLAAGFAVVGGLAIAVARGSGAARDHTAVRTGQRVPGFDFH